MQLSWRKLPRKRTAFKQPPLARARQNATLSSTCALRQLNTRRRAPYAPPWRTRAHPRVIRGHFILHSKVALSRGRKSFVCDRENDVCAGHKGLAFAIANGDFPTRTRDHCSLHNRIRLPSAFFRPLCYQQGHPSYAPPIAFAHPTRGS